MNEHLEKWALIPSDPGNLITKIKHVLPVKY